MDWMEPLLAVIALALFCMIWGALRLSASRRPAVTEDVPDAHGCGGCHSRDHCESEETLD